MPTENNSKKSVKPRKSGHYWVKWAGLYTETNIWRMGAFYADTNTWRLINDTRVFYDADFIEINEARISLITDGWVISSPLLWFVLISIMVDTSLFIYYLFTHR